MDIIKEKNLLSSIDKIRKNLLSRKEITQEILNITTSIFPNSSINIHMINNTSKELDISLFNLNFSPLSQEEYSLIFEINQNEISKNQQISHFQNSIYIASKSKYFNKKNNNKENDEILYIKIQNNKNNKFGVLTIQNNSNKATLIKLHTPIHEKINKITQFIFSISSAIETIFIHDKIKHLLSDKTKLKRKILKDEEDLKRRILELNTLNTVSHNLNNILHYKDAITIILNSIHSVIRYDICTILTTKFINNGEIHTQINKKINKNLQNSLFNQLIKSFQLLTQTKLNKSKIKYVTTETIINKSNTLSTIKSFTNIPLKFKNEVIGFISLYSEKENAFAKNEIDFLNTLSNQLSSTLGKIHLINQLEQSKISSLILSMVDPVIYYDNQNNTEIYNQSAKTVFQINETKKLNTLLNNLNIKNIYLDAKKNQSTIKNIQINLDNKVYSVNISPINHYNTLLGTILVFRDITNIKKIDRIKTQRLEAIEKINLMIKHIANLNQLLSFLINYFLTIANAEMGSIQLKIDSNFITKVHSNFPDKIRRSYKFKNNKTISDSVIESKKTIFINNYVNDPNTNPNIKILIDTYLCIPILINNEIIGIVNIARKFGSSADKITEDDIKTLTTLTNLSGTAIQNAIYFTTKQKNEKYEQELAIAKRIQKNLLPQKIPQFDKFIFAAKSKSAHFIGGDYYDIIQLNRDSIGIIIADIVGKGIPAGIHMATLKSILKSNIKSNYSPKQVLTKINTILFTDPVIDKFTPMFYGIINTKKLTFTYSNAGHEPCILLRNNKIIQLDTQGFPVGAFKKNNFEENIIKIQNEDLFVFITDGILEVKNKNNQVYGYRRLNNFIKKNNNLHPEAFINNLKENLYHFSNKNNISDDQTVIVGKVNYDISNKTRSKLTKTKEIKLSSELKNIRIIRNMIKDLLKKSNLDNSFIHDLTLAVNEAHANIIEHAYNGDNSGEIIFKFKIYNDKIEITIRDLGKGFNAVSTKQNTDSLHELDGSGLGLHIINSLIDTVVYDKKTIGTELRLTKFKNLN